MSGLIGPGQRGELQLLLAELERRGLTLPEPAQVVAGHVAALRGPLYEELRRIPDLDYSTATEAELIEHARRATVTTSLSEGAGNVLDQLAMRAETQLAELLAEHADDLLDQMRADFDSACAAFRDAYTKGIRPRQDTRTLLESGTDAQIKAWRSLPRHWGTLEGVATVRSLMCRALGLPPQYDPLQSGSSTEERLGLAFGTQGEWRVQGESVQDRWLRLNASGQCRLLTIAETKEALDGVWREPAPDANAPRSGLPRPTGPDAEGWRYFAAGQLVVLKGTDGAWHQLYRGTEIPADFVDREHLDYLVDQGDVQRTRLDKRPEPEPVVEPEAEAEPAADAEAQVLAEVPA